MTKIELPGKWSVIHAAIGGAICFIVMLLITDLAQGVLERILIFFGVIGVVIFQEQFILARSIIILGSVYLPSGFIGGLYTGYKVREGLRFILAIPGIIGFLALTIMLLALGQFSLSNIDYVTRLFLPLLGNIAGAYLGGYAMNWPSEEESAGEAEKLTLDLKR